MRKLHVVLRGAFVAAGACLLATVVRAQDLTGDVEGTVSSADDGRPIKDAVVAVFGLGRYTTSDSAGRFLLPGVRFGGQRVEVRAIGFQPIAHAVTVVPGEVTRVELRLRPAVVNLPEVVVSSSREEQLASTTPLSVGVIRGEEIRETRGHHPSELVNRTPGVYVSNLGGRGTRRPSASPSPPRRSTPIWRMGSRSDRPGSSITTRSTRSTFRRPAGWRSSRARAPRCTEATRWAAW